MRSVWDVSHLSKLTIFLVFPSYDNYLYSINLLLVENTHCLNVPFPYNYRLWTLRTLWQLRPIFSAECVFLLNSALKPVLVRKFFASPLPEHSYALIVINGMPNLRHSWLSHFYMRKLAKTASVSYTTDDIDRIFEAAGAGVLVRLRVTASVFIGLHFYPIIQHLP